MTIQEWKKESGFNQTSRLYSEILNMYNGFFDKGVDAVCEILGMSKEEAIPEIEDHYKVARVFIETHMNYMQERLIYIFKIRK